MLFEMISDDLISLWAQFDHIIDNYHILFTVDSTSSHRIQSNTFLTRSDVQVQAATTILLSELLLLLLSPSHKEQ